MEEITLKNFYSETMELAREMAAEREISLEKEITDELMDYLKLEGMVASPELIDCFNASCTKDSDAGYFKINAFDYSEESGTIDLIVTHLIDKPELPEFTKSRMQSSHNAAWRFFMRCVENTSLYLQYKESDPDVAELISTIREEYLKKNIKLVRLFLLSNGVSKSELSISDDLTITEQNIPVEEYIWDIEAARQSDVAARQEPSVDIDFEQFFEPLQCIPCDENPDVKSYMAVMPGMVLAQIYDKYRVRLLGQNVRNYLGGNKKINKKMLETIRQSGGRFFAYNNGISSTAYGVTTELNHEGKLVIKRMQNWQIVNGGQTTNVIYYIYSQKKERDLLNKVNVSLKISEIRIAEETERKQAISNIARYANSQNQIKESDFAVNEPFLRTLKEMSEIVTTSMSCPNPGTKWFFIRMRGEYEEAKMRCSGKKLREFLLRNPKSQIIEKVDLAKLEMAWNAQPYNSCLGGEKCFEKYWGVVSKKPEILPDEKYYKHLVAKQIIFLKSEEIYINMGQKGYANIIGYYVLSVIAAKSKGNLDLDYIWEHQDLPDGLRTIIEQAVKNVSDYIQLRSSDGTNSNISMLAKKSEFLTAINLRMNNLPEFDNSLLIREVSADLTPEQKNVLGEFKAITAEDWISISNWGKMNRKLSLLERKKIEHVAAALYRSKDVAYNYVEEALAIYNKSLAMGWTK